MKYITYIGSYTDADHADGVRIYEEGQQVSVVIDPKDVMAYVPSGEDVVAP